MASSFPEAIDVFPQMMDLLASDGELIKQYQSAMDSGDIQTANQIMAQVPNGKNKIISAEYMNNINNAVVSMENYTLSAYSPAYVVSNTQPANQEATDFWFQVTD